MRVNRQWNWVAGRDWHGASVVFWCDLAKWQVVAEFNGRDSIAVVGLGPFQVSYRWNR